MNERAIRITCLALLPKDGTPVATAELARLAGVQPFEVMDALFELWEAGELAFDQAADTYSYQRPHRQEAAPNQMPLFAADIVTGGAL
jgi:hypothetical protein